MALSLQVKIQQGSPLGSSGDNGECGHVPTKEGGRAMFPTPAARDYRMPNARSRSERNNGTTAGEQLPNYIAHHMGQRGLLNPDWVEMLCGFRVGWTRLSREEAPRATSSTTSGRRPRAKRSTPPSRPGSPPSGSGGDPG